MDLLIRQPNIPAGGAQRLPGEGGLAGQAAAENESMIQTEHKSFSNCVKYCRHFVALLEVYDGLALIAVFLSI